MGCQKEIAHQIVAAKGHYVLALKENHSTLYDQTKALLDEAILENFQGLKHDYHQTTEGDHGRIRRENGPENFSRLRRMVLNKLRAYQDTDGKKRSLRMKRKKCSWRFDYFLEVLTA